MELFVKVVNRSNPFTIFEKKFNLRLDYVLNMPVNGFFNLVLLFRCYIQFQVSSIGLLWGLRFILGCQMIRELLLDF